MRNAVAPSDAEALVTTIYRVVLQRAPDPDGAATYVAALRAGHDIGWLLEHFLASAEYRALISRVLPQPVYPLDRAPPMAMDADWDGRDRQEMWDHIASVWSRYGEAEPHWSVITDERFRATEIEANKAAFHQSAERDLDRLNAWLNRNNITVDGVCAEYGCGVGRVTGALARQFDRVIGFDISLPHLKVAQEQLQSNKVENFELVHVRSRDQLDRLVGIDLFYSVIVLQHNPPPIIVDVLEHAFAGLNPGGVAYFQLPTYGLGYEFSAAAYRTAMADITEMEIHFLAQSVVFEIARRHGVDVIEVQPDDWLGNSIHWISTTFLLRKPYPGQPGVA
jgi:SAM-dependent methyltransferase